VSRLDVHAHFIPDGYRKALEEAGHASPDGFPAIPLWDPAAFLHPTSPACWQQTAFGRPRPMLEFLFDTTRTVVDLVLNGTVARHSNIEWIIPHAGASLPVIADRVALFSFLLPDVDTSVDVMRDLSRLHYDLAGTPLPRQLDALLSIATLDHLHYGTDYPFTPELAVRQVADALDAVRESSGLADPAAQLSLAGLAQLCASVALGRTRTSGI
jgi:predicted TIM-barrel fold metal-dependent hydrolase